MDLLKQLPHGQTGMPALQQLCQKWAVRWPSMQQPSAEVTVTVINSRRLLLDALAAEWRGKADRRALDVRLISGLQPHICWATAGSARTQPHGILLALQRLQLLSFAAALPLQAVLTGQLALQGMTGSLLLEGSAVLQQQGFMDPAAKLLEEHQALAGHQANKLARLKLSLAQVRLPLSSRPPTARVQALLAGYPPG